MRKKKVSDQYLAIRALQKGESLNKHIQHKLEAAL